MHQRKRNSIWDEQSTEYWKNHKDTTKSPSSSTRLVLLSMVLLGLSGALVYSKGFFIQETSTVIPDVGPTPATRSACSSRAVSTSWHESSCRNTCSKYRQQRPMPQVYKSCMDGCSYATMSVAKSVCAQGTGESDAPCPVALQCRQICKSYQNELPKPMLIDTCKTACSSIKSASCSRALGILKDEHEKASVKV